MNEQRTVRVLVVDDQELIREGLRRIFDVADGFLVAGECGDGDEVVAAVSSTRPDVVLMDMRMKRVDGASAMRRLEEVGDPPPVLVLTTFDDRETLEAALGAGAAGFMLKESVGVDLLRALRTVADGGAWIDPEVAPMVMEAYRASGARRAALPLDTVAQLTDRELEVLRAIAHGRTNHEIAEELFISERTVKTHVGHVFAKLQVRDRVAAVLFARDAGLVDDPTP